MLLVFQFYFLQPTRHRSPTQIRIQSIPNYLIFKILNLLLYIALVIYSLRDPLHFKLNEDELFYFMYLIMYIMSHYLKF